MDVVFISLSVIQVLDEYHNHVDGVTLRLSTAAKTGPIVHPTHDM
jgi:hypothetical protein